MESLSWVTCKGNDWCPLETVNLSEVDTTGVYIIWYNGNPGKVVRVGQGDIADRLTKHRKDQEILAHKKSGTLYVTWASVADADERDGIEAYFGQWNPLVGDTFPDVEPIAVNSPWG